MKLIGILFVVFGLLALASGGISYTKRGQVLDLGTLQPSTAARKTLPVAPIAGIAALLSGLALIVAGSKPRIMG